MTKPRALLINNKFIRLIIGVEPLATDIKYLQYLRAALSEFQALKYAIPLPDRSACVT